MWKWRLAVGLVVCGLALAYWRLPLLRRELMTAVNRYDAVPRPPAPLPAGTGPGLAPAAHTRVIVVDGLAEHVAKTLPAWTAVCERGLTLRVDVGFPTVSLPVAVAMWTGLTQQQTGIMNRYNRPLEQPIAGGIPAQVPGAIGITEGVMVQKPGAAAKPGNYGWIGRSLGFPHYEPEADPKKRHVDQDGAAWAEAWRGRALEAVAGEAPLVFVHLMSVDAAGHIHGMSDEYRRAALAADGEVGALVAAKPDARWFLVSDHGHIAGGGHGGEEPSVRVVQACIAGPGVAPGTGGPLHIVDIARALADSVGAALGPEARGRPLSAALAAPLEGTQAIPALGTGPGALALFVLVAGLGLSAWSVRRWWLAPWWFVAAGAALVIARGEPTLSMPMVHRPDGADMHLVWLPALALAAAATWFGLRAQPVARVIVSQLAIPVAAVAAVLTAIGAWPTLVGEEIAPVVPRYTAYASPLLLMVAHGAAAVGLAALARLVLPRSGPRAPAAPPRSEPAAASPAPAAAPPDPAG